MEDVIGILGDYIRQEFGYEGPLDPQLDLLEAQVIDSFSIVQLAVFVQEKFGVELEADDLVRDNLSRLSSIAALIERKNSAGQV